MTALVLFCVLFSTAATTDSSAYDSEIAAAVLDVANVYYVPPALVRAVIRCESNFNPTAISKSGAIGLMQIMPFTAARVGLTPADLWDPRKNILAGTRLLAVLLEYYQGDLISTLVAYNARPGRAFAPIPRNGETPHYVAAVLKHFIAQSRATSPNGTSASAAIKQGTALPPLSFEHRRGAHQ